MKVTRIAAVIVLAAGISACSKQETAASAPASAPAAPAVSQPATPAAPEAPAADKQSLVDTGAQVMSLLTKAKGLIAEKKYAEALDVLKEVSALKLNPDQQKQADDVKAQAQKAMTDAAAAAATKKATDAVGGLLGK